MVKPDIVITVPYGIESPYFRWWVNEYKDMLGKVIIGYYDDHRQYNFVEFMKEQLPWATHVDIGEVKGRDWRDDTVNACLKHSDNEWVMFVEDDFIFSKDILVRILTEAEDFDVVGYGDMGEWSADVRLHPAFIMCRRTFIEKTRKDFGAYPDKNRDHFATFTEDLFNLDYKRYLNIEGYGWDHLKGTYSNYMLVLAGQKPNYEPKKFKEYVAMTVQLPNIKWDERFKKWTEMCLS